LYFGFDPHMAERTRAKDTKAYTREENEWSTIDKILFPEVWRYYTHNHEGMPPDKHAAEANKTGEVAPPGNNRSIMGNAATNKNKEMEGGERAAQMANAASLGRILGMGAEMQAEGAATAGGLSMEEMAMGAQKSLKKKHGFKPFWNCPFDKEGVIKVWRTPQAYLKSEDEKKTYKLLHKFNGTFKAYTDNVREGARRNKNMKRMGSHINHNVKAKYPAKVTRLGGNRPL
jgi:hypothetical protein